MEVPTREQQHKWIKAGVALFCALNYIFWAFTVHKHQLNTWSICLLYSKSGLDSVRSSNYLLFAFAMTAMQNLVEQISQSVDVDVKRRRKATKSQTSVAVKKNAALITCRAARHTFIAVDLCTPVCLVNFSLSKPITNGINDITESFRFNLGTTF